MNSMIIILCIFMLYSIVFYIYYLILNYKYTIIKSESNSIIIV